MDNHDPKPRILISGAPRSGKTTLANVLGSLGLSVFHTDELMGNNTYQRQAHLIASALEDNEYDVYEGCMVAPAILEWRELHIDEKPCELYITLPNPVILLEPNQRKFNIYLHPKLESAEDWLNQLGVLVLGER